MRYSIDLGLEKICQDPDGDFWCFKTAKKAYLSLLCKMDDEELLGDDYDGHYLALIKKVCNWELSDVVKLRRINRSVGQWSDLFTERLIKEGMRNND